MNILGLFKKEKKETPNLSPVVTEAPRKVYPPEVEQIHMEFFTAADLLVEEAKSVLKQAESLNAQKVKRLISLGFKNAKQVQEVEPVMKKAELGEEQIKLIRYYQHNYPLNKFITEEQVKQICYKYNLVCGDVSRYKGFVPEKNLREIERFKLKDQEASTMIIEAYAPSGNSIGTFTAQGVELKRLKGEAYWHIYKKSGDKYEYSFQQDSESTLPFMYGSDRSNLFGLQEMGYISAIRVCNHSLQICAPVKDMDTRGLEIKDGYKLSEKIHIPDPVVLQPVKGGYLILTAWGDEASDPIVVNQINN